MPTRRRSLLDDSIPEPAGVSQQQSQPRLGLLGTAENVSMGLGRGVTNQLAGMLGMVQNPGAVVNSLYQLSRTPPNQLAQMAVSGVQGAARNALAGPLGFGEFIGNNISPRSLLPGVKTTRELTAYHGTPHDFDEFKLEKIGTGEGAQAYGHGLYFAESPEVAGSYAKILANRNPDTGRATAHLNAQQWVSRLGDEDYAAEVFQDKVAEALRDGTDVKPFQDTLEMIKSGAYKNPLKDQGKLYTVDIPDEAIAQMLDWDAPLDKQPAHIYNAIRQAYMDKKITVPSNGPVGAMVLDLGKNLGSSADASKYLLSKGIPGIRYLDGGSRAGGKGTRNFVVFDDKLVKVLKKE